MSIEAEHRSLCPVCGFLIDIGDLIVRDEDDNWVHAHCANEDSDE